jgi:competence protein ComEA
MRRHPPPEVDPDRLRVLLASARARPDPPRRHGWVPEEEPSAADTSWLDESSVWEDGPSLVQEEDHRIAQAAASGRRGRSRRRRRPDSQRQTRGEGPPDGMARWPDIQPPPGVPRSDGNQPSGGGRHRPHPRVLTVPVAFRGARVGVSVHAVVAFLVVLVVAVVFFAVRVARAQQAAAPQPVPSGEGVVGRASVPSAFASSSAQAAGGTTTTVGDPSSTAGAVARGSPGRLLVVDVVGHVARPGVVTVPDGSRVVDVLAAAGGALPGADVQRLNLARQVADGEQVFVPKPGETPPILIGGVSGPATGSGASVGGAGGGGGGSGGGTASNTPVDLNTATLAALDTLPGVGPVLAQRILDWRAQHGRFTSVDELGEVSGIGDKLLEQIRPKVTV